MENKFLKISVGVGALFLGFAAVYYFSVFMPNIEKEKYTQTQVEKCSEASQKLYDQLINEVETEGHIFNYGHENYYNKKLNTCFLSYGYGYGDVIARYVKNVYTNKTVLSYGIAGNKDWDISYDEYEKQRKELFDQ
jgi:hypothetical protein